MARRPPRRDTRIKEGECRNPWGRNGKPKPPIGFLEQEITISLNGTAMTVTRREALSHFLFANAAKGQVAPNRFLHRLHPEEPVEVNENEPDLTEEEREVLEEFIRHAATKAAGGDT